MYDAPGPFDRAYRDEELSARFMYLWNAGLRVESMRIVRRWRLCLITEARRGASRALWALQILINEYVTRLATAGQLLQDR